MSYCQINGVDVETAQIHMPRVGVWHADLAVNISSTLSEGAGATITAGGFSWQGAVKRAGLSRGRLFARVVGGAGGLGGDVKPKAYRGIPLRAALSDILRDTGEKLSATADAGALSKIVDKYAHVAQPGGVALAALLRLAGSDIVWRMLRDGTIWIGRESWKPRQTDVQVIHEEPSLGRFRAYVLPELVPGDSLDGRHVSYVEHDFGEDALRTRVWVED